MSFNITNTFSNTLVSIANSSTTPLNASIAFTGTAEDVSLYPSITVACKTDQEGTLVVQLSPDGTNWDSSLTFDISASVNEVHRITVTRKYFRIVLTNTSITNQTYLRLQTLFGNQQTLTSSLNALIQSDQDSIVTRPLDFNLMVAEGLYQDRQNTIKDGINFDVDTGTVPEDITNEGGVYAGFPTGAVEAGEIIVAGADTGTVYYSYLENPTSTNYIFGSKAIAGAGTYSLGHNIWRSNFAYFVSTNPAAFNVGAITLRNTITIANIFWKIDIGFSQTYCAAYTVPYGSSVYIDRFTGNMRGSTSGSTEGYIWYRESGGSPRLRFPFELQFGTLYFDDIDYLVKIPERVDFIPRITFASANNTVVKFSYRLLKVGN